MKTIYLTDRSRIVTREECERKRFLQYDFDIQGAPVRGLQRKEMSLPLLTGDELHIAHARVLGGHSVESTVANIIKSYHERVEKRGVYGEGDMESLITEQTNLLIGMLTAFNYLWVPRILEEYDVISIEKPQQWQLAPGLVLNLREDTSLRRKADGQRVTLDYKSIPYITDDAQKKLERSRQTTLYVLAAEELYGEPVEIAYLQSAKGMRRKDTAKSSPFYEQKIQASPYLYAYILRGGVGDVYQTAYTSKKGFQKFRTYEEMPMSEWMDWLWKNERNTINEQFSFVPPMAQTPAEMLRIKNLVIREELEFIHDVDAYYEMLETAEKTGNEVLRQKAAEWLDTFAPMRDEVCYKYGQDSVCPMFGLCHNEGALERVLEDGEYEPREAHHVTELLEAA